MHASCYCLLIPLSRPHWSHWWTDAYEKHFHHACFVGQHLILILYYSWHMNFAEEWIYGIPFNTYIQTYNLIHTCAYLSSVWAGSSQLLLLLLNSLCFHIWFCTLSFLLPLYVTHPTLGAVIKVHVTKPATVSLHSSKYNPCMYRCMHACIGWVLYYKWVL